MLVNQAGLSKCHLQMVIISRSIQLGWQEHRLPDPGKMLITPLGNPAFAESSANLSAVNGVTYKDISKKEISETCTRSSKNN